jgi:hypothetical protein
VCEMSVDERREQVIDRIVHWIQARGLVEPALLFIEASRPLLPIGSQALLLVQPFLGWLGGDRELQDYAALFEDPAGVECILSRLESGPVE